MVVIVSKNATKEEVAIAKEKLKRKKNVKGNLSKYFGSLKRGLDGLEYQKKVRDEWS